MKCVVKSIEVSPIEMGFRIKEELVEIQENITFDVNKPVIFDEKKFNLIQAHNIRVSLEVQQLVEKGYRLIKD